MRLLIERGGVDINVKDKNEWTPLSWTVNEGREAVV